MTQRIFFLASLLVLLAVARARADVGYLDEGSVVAWGSDGYGETNVPSGDDFVQVAAGNVHSLAMRADGSVVGFGYDEDGETNVPAGTYSYIAAGGFQSVGVTTSGTVVQWGDNSNGLANSPSGSNFATVAAGLGQDLALSSSGSMSGWGYNAYGQATPRAGSNFVQIAAGAYQSLALTSAGTLVAWGFNNDGQSVAPAGNGYVQIACGGAHDLALKANGTLTAWGADEFGQIDIPAGMTFTQVTGGVEQTLAIKTDGSLAAWGENDSGQTNVPAGNQYLDIAAGGSQGLAIAARDSYQDLLIQHVSSFTNNDTLLQRAITVSDDVTINGNLNWDADTGQMSVAGNVTIMPGSTLTVLLNPADLTQNQSFQLLSSPTPIIGQFAQIDLPALGPTFQWNTSEFYTNGSISLVPEPTGLPLLLIAEVLLASRALRGKPAGIALPRQNNPRH